MKINDIICVKIEKLVFGGEGIAKHGDLVIFVPMSVPGDELKVKIISIKKTYARGLITEIIKPSIDRISSDKITFEDYSGCDFAMMNYEAQIKNKSMILKDVFKRIAKEDIKEDIYVEKSENIFNYRNKVAEPFIKINGEIKTGFFKKKSHEIFVSDEVNLRANIATIVLDKLLLKLNKYMGTKKEYKVFNDITNTGFLKTCVIRNNDMNEVMLVLVVNGKSSINRLKETLIELYNENDEIKSIYISVKNKLDNVIFGEEFIKISGSSYIVENLFGINFKIYPNSFFQINKKQTEKLYLEALNFLGDYKDKNVIDAFSGTGTIAMIMSKKANKVIGLEIVPESVKSAIKTSNENNIKNVEFLVGKVEETISRVLENNNIDYIVFDPPRKGIDKSILEKVNESGINKLVYISCDPTTLARDIGVLKEYGYKLEFIKGFDMFPQTHHIETVVLLSKLKIKKHVDIELHADELDLISSECKVTYNNIKQYVFDKYGFKVSNLYIAQVKEKYGIKEIENYNKPKNNDSKHAICPIEKEKAIKDAFRYFQII
ncbi:23S rRNA (uracil(1939)-C(5))-methyltransferase RlmD [Streptobacillus moniliformis]|uniref:23S rRNA (uracil(1939)-C(5))-methyltransferase RlmD n=2 Tax=Streptobacillus moniliformis TaxID=34105 RepID=UPI0007E4C3C2